MHVKKLVGAILLIGGSVAGVLIFVNSIRNELGMPLSDSRDPDPSYNSVYRTYSDSSSSDSTSPHTDVPIKISPELLFLGDYCPELLNEGVWSDEECLGSIEEHFTQRAAYTVNYVGMVPRDAPYTYGELFENLEDSKKHAIEALSRPECWLLDGPIRLDLRNSCNADAFSRLATVARLCSSTLGLRDYFKPRRNGKSRYQNNLRSFEYRLDSSDEHKVDMDAYYLARNSNREFLLRNVWLESSGKCPRWISFGSFRILDDDALDKALKDWWIENARLRFADEHPMIAIAARLGAEHVIIYERYVPLIGESELISSKRKIFPWLLQLRDAGVSGPYNREESLLNAVNGLIGLRVAGYDADVESIARIICETSPEQRKLEHLEDCSTAFSTVEALLDPKDTERLRTLDEIATASLELNTYKNF